MNNNINSGIYKIINKENKKYYIGSSLNLKYRISRHKRELKNNIHNNKKLQRAWNKYGEGSFDFVIVELVEPQLVLEVEQKYLDIAFQKHPNAVYNLAKNSRAPMTGVESPNKGKEFSSETRAKMSKSRIGKQSPNKGNKASMETRLKMSIDRKGKQSYTIFSKDLIDNIRNTYLSGEYTQKEISEKFNISRTHTTNILNNKRWYCAEYDKSRKDFKNPVKPMREETRMKLSKSSKGRKWSEETRKKITEQKGNKVSVIQLDLNGVFQNKYNSASEAADKMNIDNSGIVKACKGKYKTAGGYKWMYLEEYEKNKSAN